MDYIGIDLGTSAVKLLLVTEDGRILRSVSKEYPLSFPQPGWSEQDPADWWDGVCSGMRELLCGFDASRVAGIGVGGLNFNNDAYIDAIFANEAVVGPSVFNLEQNELTAPIKGQNCVFVAEKISEDRYTAEFDEASESLRTRAMASSRIMNALLEELYYQAKVVDNRYKIF